MMFDYSNERMNKIMENDYDRDQMLTAYREFTGQIKLLNTIVKAYQVGEKNANVLPGLKKMGMLNETEPPKFNKKQMKAIG